MSLEDRIKQLPTTAGVYQYFDKDMKLLYIGKAKNLASRVKSYFNFTPYIGASSNLSVRITCMIEQTVSMNYIVVKSEHDALILENSLIKELNPKYNILLRDDKTYPYIYIDYSKPYPRLEITREIIKSPHITYYGPYSIGARDILESIYEICKLVQKKGSLKNKRRCLYHQIDRCLAPCELHVEDIEYKKELDLAIRLIDDNRALIKLLQAKMQYYAEELRFEEAGELRDRSLRISRSNIKSDIDFATDENYDIFALKSSQSRVVVVRMFMRNGKIISSTHSYIRINDGVDIDELYKRVLLEFYKDSKPPIIAPILVSSEFKDLEILESHLTILFNKKAHIIYPQRGRKKQLIDLAILNGDELLKADDSKDKERIIQDIKELCKLQRTPSRVEIFDNSHISGVATVGAMVVYENHKFDKRSYRTYHLEAKDEYAQMRETLTKRVSSFAKNSPPDLWIIDGGATLLKLALSIVESMGVCLDVIAISKEKIDAKTHRAKGKANDIIYTKDEVFRLKNSDKRVQFVQLLRDEAHRLAITFHKKTKLKLDKESKLLNLKGISQVKIVKLLNHFGTFQAIKELSEDEISSILNTKDAKIIKCTYK